ncbi:hypothetical protein D3C86_1802130 [compost metagenome]
MGLPALGARVLTGAGQGGEQHDGAQQQPAQPDTLSLAFAADQIHAIVPVPRADGGQAIAARQLYGLIQSASAMFKQGGRFVGDGWQEEGILFVQAQLRAFQKRNDLIENGVIGRV